MSSSARPRGSGLRECRQPLVEVYDTAMFDLDGVVYLGGEPVAGSSDHVARAGEAGMTLAFVTNNASRPPAEVAERLRRIGVACRPEDVVTSAQAAARLVATRVPGGSHVLVVGGRGLQAALAEHDLVGVSAMDDDPAAVVQGFDPDVGWRLLAEGTVAVRAGLPWIASNIDATVPSVRGRVPGNGLLVEVIASATGKRPVVAGKPEPPLFEETLLRVGGERPLVVGDRLDTDIEGAVRCDADSLLVMTGVTDVPVLAAAKPGRRPSFVAADLAGLFTPHPVPTGADDEWHCGGWAARVVTDGAEYRPELRGSGSSADALRALATLCWQQQDREGVSWPDEVVDSAWRTALPAMAEPDQPLRYGS
ncbi:MAG: HAD-IIA family hydrolase [Nocardioidaceae bacterium]